MNNDAGVLQILELFQSERATVLALLVVGTLYFLAPAVGYVSTKRGTLSASMWALIVKLGIGLFRSLYGALMMVGGSGSPGFGRGRGGTLLASFEQMIAAGLPLAEMVVFLAAMVLFVLGLQRLARRDDPFRGTVS
jgi:hypothetical protein